MLCTPPEPDAPQHSSFHLETFRENVTPSPQLVTYHVSCVTCQVSHVMCHVSHVSLLFFLFFLTVGVSWLRVSYQRGLPRLVFIRVNSFEDI